MLHEPARHEPLNRVPWNEAEARATIEAIVRDTDRRFSDGGGWPWHPKDLEPTDDFTQAPLPMYHGAAGIAWALRYLQSVGAGSVARNHDDQLASLLERVRTSLRASGGDEAASYMMGETPILLMLHAVRPTSSHADRLATLIERNLEHPARDLMWGSPGTMLAALFLYERTGEQRWAALFRNTAARLWAQLEWSSELECHYWTQTLGGQRTTYLDAIHGFVGTAFVLIRGRELLDEEHWQAWRGTIANTISRTATRADGKANWPTQLRSRGERRSKLLMQFCHGAPGFLICLAKFPDAMLDQLLLAAGEAVWAAGPLNKGSNLCHGTGGNGYALLELYGRTGDPLWLERSRAFAMHGIGQTRADEREYGQFRYSLWTGDLGFAIYLWDCIRGQPAFPTLEVF